ncbi:MAG: hypothetical protein HY328_16445 [Chloroflexi bacterium]|nr:hypothetical protein [Chloroflexota bacterium]
MLSYVMNLVQGKSFTSTQTNSRPQALPFRFLANDTPRRRSGRQDHHRPSYSPFFFMTLIVTIICSIAFAGLLSVAIGAG